MENFSHLGRSLYVYNEGDKIVIRDISSPQRVIRVDRADAAELAAFLEGTDCVSARTPPQIGG